jgi:hypothetical protein
MRIMHPSIDASTACWSDALQIPTPIAEEARKITRTKIDLETVKCIFLRHFGYIWSVIRVFSFESLMLYSCNMPNAQLPI